MGNMAYSDSQPLDTLGDILPALQHQCDDLRKFLHSRRVHPLVSLDGNASYFSD